MDQLARTTSQTRMIHDATLFSNGVWIVVIFVLSCLLLSVWALLRVKFVDKDEQLVVEGLTEQTIIDGPCIATLPLLIKSSEKRKVLSIEPMEFCIVKNTLSGKKRVETGPKLVLLKPYDKIETDGIGCEKRTAISLKANEYVRLMDNLTGKVRVVVGERGCVVPGPDEVYVDVGGKKKAMDLQVFEYVKIQDKRTGTVRTERGEKLVFVGPYEEFLGRKQTAIEVDDSNAVLVRNKRSGQQHLVTEKKLFVPTADEEILEVRQAMDLQVFEYVKIQDKKTGAVRTERGETLVFLGPYEECLGGKQTAVEVDDSTAVLVRNKRSGQQHLVTEKKLFVPTADEEILEVRDLIKLAEYEACIVRSKTGEEVFHFGKNESERSFFLPPHSELVTLLWSRGRRRERRDLRITKLDLRPMYMSFEFNCRTNDNVELVLEGSFFWEVVDLQAMVKFTNDTTGDICNHARSRFIERVSKVTLREFMTQFNSIAAEVHEHDESNFYTQRGVKIHSLEVTGYHCAESSTAAILEQIIQETTNRMNRLQQQESENEVQLQQIRGDIEEEKARGELLEIQTANSNARSRMEGTAEAERVKSFLSDLEKEFSTMDMKTRIGLWNTLRKEDALRAVAKGNAKLYFTPRDVNLSIENHDHVHEASTSSWEDGAEEST